MTLAALQTLIAAGESLTLELKKSTAEKDRACRSLCALANGQGGQVVFGVTPSGKVVGQKVNDHTLTVHADFVTMTFALPISLARSKNTDMTGKTRGKVTGKTSGKKSGKTSVKTPDLILQQLTVAPNTSIPELALQLSISSRSIERNIRQLRADGKLVRVGPAKGGSWRVVL